MKQAIFGKEAREKMLAGANKIANAIVSTMGPKGRTVIFEGSVGQPIATKDGVTVAKNMEVEDKFENLGANMVKQVSMKMNDSVGDGTTTVSALARILMNECHKNITAGHDPIELRRDLEAGKDQVVAYLKKVSKEVKTRDEIFQVASISANNKDIGNIIADVVEKTGKDGIITVEESQSLDMTSEIIDGFEINAGYVSPYMINDESRTKAVFENVPILISEKKVEAITDIMPILDALAKSGEKQCVLLVEDITEAVLSFLVVNKVKGFFNSVVVKAPLFGEKKKDLLNDIAILTGGSIVSDETGVTFANVTPEHLGRVGKIIAKRDKTAFINGSGDKEKVKERIEQLKNLQATFKGEFDKEKIKIRLAHLNSSVGVIRVGGTTEMELKEKKYRIDDALCATRAANDMGIVPGGGVALLRAIDSVGKQDSTDSVGIKILKKALEEPIRCIAQNAGFDPAVVIGKVKEHKGNYGFNAETGEYSKDLLKDGIIDPTKVVKEAIENAVSIAIMFLSTDTIIIDKPEPADEGKYRNER